MKPKNLFLTTILLLFGLICSVYLLQLNYHLGSTLFLVPPLVATLAGIYAARTYHLRNVHGITMALFAAGMLCFLIGETIFYVDQFILHTDPFPSVADFFYLAAYPLLLLAFLKEISQHKVDWHNFNKFVLIVILLLMLALSFIVGYFGIYLAYDSQVSLMSNVIAISYGVADLIIIVPSLFILKLTLDYRGGKLFNSWAMILFALMLMMAGDILFAIFNQKYSDLVWPYTLIDLTWVASYLLFSYSFFYTARTIRDLNTRLLK